MENKDIITKFGLAVALSGMSPETYLSKLPRQTTGERKKQADMYAAINTDSGLIDVYHSGGWVSFKYMGNS